MGLFDYLFDSEWSQRADINSLDNRAQKLENRLWKTFDQGKDAALQLQELRREFAHLVMMVDVLSQVIVDHGICTKADLLVLLDKSEHAQAAVEAARPLPSGPQPRTCPACGHVIGRLAHKCIYCGASFPDAPAADGGVPLT